MGTKDWKPELYLKFGKERIKPTIDLVNRIESINPLKIIDIGCGPGNSTQILFERWPKANITGVDNSPAMIEHAKQANPQINWQLIDAGKDEINEKYDVIFSNATIQWIPNHIELLQKFSNMLTNNGLIAIQMPLFWNMPLGKSIARIAKNKRWATTTERVTNLFTIHNAGFYYDHLAKLFNTIEIWETSYIHIMDSHQAILEMISSTGLRPYINQLESEKDQIDFQNLVLKDIRKDYPEQKDGKVLFPFERLFFIASKTM